MHNAFLGRVNPENQYFINVIIDDAGRGVQPARPQGMLGEEKGNRQAEQNLRCLPNASPERAPVIEAPQYQDEMGEKGAIQKDGAGPAAPHRNEDVAPDIERLHRGQAPRMIY